METAIGIIVGAILGFLIAELGFKLYRYINKIEIISKIVKAKIVVYHVKEGPFKKDKSYIRQMYLGIEDVDFFSESGDIVGFYKWNILHKANEKFKIMELKKNVEKDS